MVRTRVFLKASAAVAVVIGASGPLAASDQIEARTVLGAPATSGEQYLDKKFNFSPPELTERQRLVDDRFNYVRERDKLEVLPAK
jgi:hypothetical protein